MTKEKAQPNERGKHPVFSTRPALLEQLNERYTRKDQQSAWRLEGEPWGTVLNAVVTDPGGISFNYGLERVLNIGGAAAVFRVVDFNLYAEGLDGELQGEEDQRRRSYRALKVPRPHAERGKLLAQSLNEEISRLASLNHPHVVSLFAKGSVPLKLSGEEVRWPWYVMEYIDDAIDLDELCSSDAPDLMVLIRLLYQAALGLQYVHGQGMVHCDVKPANIFVVKDCSRALLADFGYAKHIRSSGKLTTVGFTDYFAHPDLQFGSQDASQASRTFTHLKRKKIRPAFDLFALGMTIHYLLERFYCHHLVYAKYAYEIKFLRLCAARLLDGLNHQKEITYSDFPYFAFGDLKQPDGSVRVRGLRYQGIDDFVADLEKVLGYRSLEARIPELIETRRDNIQVSDTAPAVYTARVRAVVDHTLVRRLASVSQLGLVSLVYPGATHSRLEHALGTLGVTARYIRSLENDKLDPFFRQVVGEKEAKLVLLAALLHDIGQYPLAHDLEDVSVEFFGHEGFGAKLLETKARPKAQGLLFPEIEDEPGDLARDLADRIEDEWEIGLAEVVSLLRSRSTEEKKQWQVGSNVERLLKSLIDGPIDADKLDYLVRDSRHCNVQYGFGIDFTRLLKCLTVARQEVGPEHLLLVMGIQDKGRVSAESIAFVRYAMLTQVYWHHTMRALKASLHHAAASALVKANNWNALQDSFFGCAVLGRDLKDQDWVRVLAGSEAAGSIHFGDLRVLGWLWLNTTRSGREAVESILKRRLYKRLLVVYRGGLEEDVIGKLDRVFSPECFNDRCSLRDSIERALLVRLKAENPSSALLETSGFTAEDWSKEMGREESLRCLVDYPAARAGASFGLQVVRQWGGRPLNKGEEAGGRPLEEVPRLIQEDSFKDGMRSLERSLSCLRIYWEPREYPVMREILDEATVKSVVINEIRRFQPSGRVRR